MLPMCHSGTGDNRSETESSLRQERIGTAGGMIAMHRTGRFVSTAAVAAALLLGIVGAGRAQDATPTAGEDAAPGYPNHFHAGTCANLTPEPAIALADLQFPDWVAALSAEGDESTEVVVPEPDEFGNAPIPAAVATTEVAVPLADIVAGKHAINVHDAADPSLYIACGNVGGVPDERGDLFIGLGEQNDSGYTGAAWLHDNGSSTTVVVFLTHPAAQPGIESSLAALVAAAAEEEAAASPEATPEASPVAEVDATPVT